MAQFIRKLSKSIFPEPLTDQVDFALPPFTGSLRTKIVGFSSELAYWSDYRNDINSWFLNLRERKIKTPGLTSSTHKQDPYPYWTTLLLLEDLLELEMEITFGGLEYSSIREKDFDLLSIQSAIRVARHGRSFVYYATTSSPPLPLQIKKTDG